MPIAEPDWEKLARAIRQQRCILVLGNRLATADGGAKLADLLAAHLADRLEKQGLDVDADFRSNLPFVAQQFLTRPAHNRVDLEDIAADFLTKKTQRVPPVYARLARLPFTVALSLSPDDFLEKALRSAGKMGCQPLFYHLDNQQPEQHLAAKPTEARPLVYSLFGSMADRSSLVLTQEDRLILAKNIVQGNPAIPNDVLSQFNDPRKTWILLGLNLENWDYRLLFEALQLSSKNRSFLPSAQPPGAEARSFYENHFQISIVDSGVDAFLDSLEKALTDLDFEEKKAENALLSSKKIVLLFDANDRDARCAETLTKHLSSGEGRGLWSVWHRNLPVFDDLEAETARQLADADAVVPILSASFFSEKELMQNWLPVILNQHRERGLQIVPLLHRDCDFEDTQLARFPILPTGGKPLRNWPDEDEAFKNTVVHLKKLLHG